MAAVKTGAIMTMVSMAVHLAEAISVEILTAVAISVTVGKQPEIEEIRGIRSTSTWS